MAQKDEIYRFVNKKIILLDGDTSWARGMCAKLRRGIGKPPGELPALWEITLADAPEDWDSRNGVASYEQNAVHTALTLYALHRQGKNCSMSQAGGDSLGNAAARTVKGESDFESVKRRFDAVVTATVFLELANHVRGMIQILKSENLMLDYPRFAFDLYCYQVPSLVSGVRLRWGQDFYGSLSKNNNGKEEDE